MHSSVKLSGTSVCWWNIQPKFAALSGSSTCSQDRHGGHHESVYEVKVRWRCLFSTLSSSSTCPQNDRFIIGTSLVRACRHGPRSRHPHCLSRLRHLRRSLFYQIQHLILPKNPLRRTSHRSEPLPRSSTPTGHNQRHLQQHANFRLLSFKNCQRIGGLSLSRVIQPAMVRWRLSEAGSGSVLRRRLHSGRRKLQYPTCRVPRLERQYRERLYLCVP